jgi:chaperonin cofactor prefoldin
MNKLLVTTLSLTLLLSTPIALKASPGETAKKSRTAFLVQPNPLEKIDSLGRNPYQQKAALEKNIEQLKQEIERLKKDQAAIPETIKKFALESSTQNNDTARVTASNTISGLDRLAATTALLIKEKEAKLNEHVKTELPALAARIKTLEPSPEKLALLIQYRADAKAWMGAWGTDKSKFTYITTIKSAFIEENGKLVKNTQGHKVQRYTVAKSDKSAPVVTAAEFKKTLDDERAMYAYEATGTVAYLKSFVVTPKGAPVSYVYKQAPAATSTSSSSSASNAAAILADDAK